MKTLKLLLAIKSPNYFHKTENQHRRQADQWGSLSGQCAQFLASALRTRGRS